MFNIEQPAYLFPQRVVDDTYCTVEYPIHRSMVREHKWSSVVLRLLQILSFPEDPVAPGRYPCFFTITALLDIKDQNYIGV